MQRSTRGRNGGAFRALTGEDGIRVGAVTLRSVSIRYRSLAERGGGLGFYQRSPATSRSKTPARSADILAFSVRTRRACPSPFSSRISPKHSGSPGSRKYLAVTPSNLLALSGRSLAILLDRKPPRKYDLENIADVCQENPPCDSTIIPADANDLTAQWEQGDDRLVRGGAGAWAARLGSRPGVSYAAMPTWPIAFKPPSSRRFGSTAASKCGTGRRSWCGWQLPRDRTLAIQPRADSPSRIARRRQYHAGLARRSSPSASTSELSESLRVSPRIRPIFRLEHDKDLSSRSRISSPLFKKPVDRACHVLCWATLRHGWSFDVSRTCWQRAGRGEKGIRGTGKRLSRTGSKRDSAMRRLQVASVNKAGAHREHTSAGQSRLQAARSVMSHEHSSLCQSSSIRRSRSGQE